MSYVCDLFVRLEQSCLYLQQPEWYLHTLEYKNITAMVLDRYGRGVPYRTLTFYPLLFKWFPFHWFFELVFLSYILTLLLWKVIVTYDFYTNAVTKIRHNIRCVLKNSRYLTLVCIPHGSHSFKVPRTSNRFKIVL